MASRLEVSGARLDARRACCGGGKLLGRDGRGNVGESSWSKAPTPRQGVTLSLGWSLKTFWSVSSTTAITARVAGCT